MKKKLLTILLILAALCLACAAAVAEDYSLPLLGQPFPDFEVETIDGGRFSLHEALENYDAVLVNFWASWCGPCRMEFPYLEEAYEEYQDRVAVIALSVEPEDTQAVLLAYAAENGMTFPVANEGDLGLGDIYAPEGIPTSVVIDRYGNAVLIEVGSQPSANPFRRIFDAVLAEDYAEGTVFYEVPPALPTVDRVDEASLSSVLNAQGGKLWFTNPEDAAVWPMEPVEVDGRDPVVSTNQEQDGTVSRVLVNVEAAEGDALAFDFKTSTEAACDLLRVEVDGEVVKSFGGEHDWTTWAVALPAGTHQIGFAYVKDDYGSAGFDAVYVDEVRLVSGDEAAALIAALPAGPAAEAFAIRVVSDARELAVDDPDGALQAYFGVQQVWIADGDSIDVRIGLTADMDPETAFAYSDYSGDTTPVTALDIDGDAYVSSSGVDTLDQTGYSYTGVYVYADIEAEPGDGLCGILVFADEENANAFMQEAADEGIQLSWTYADGSAPATDALAQGEAAGPVTYTVTFVDQDGAPVPGCIVNFCTDEACTPVIADESGVAVFTGAPYAYHLQVLKVPEGYAFDTSLELYTEESGGELTFTVTRE